eukprot:TRINITY_DN29641_c0_g1_i1.p2 TRINITY_DN29641_c0_g1~~TRINITY_DN29641_c0_g1_i1.p2  ORF type:complete len:244 (+),score=42.13 TRINITY_DN29641_c0_g1_i1:2-733(+)
MSQETSKIKKRLKVLMEKYQMCHVQFEKLISYYGDNLQTLDEKDFWTSIVGFVERFSMHQRSAYRDLKDEIEKRKRTLKRQLTSKKDLGVGDLEKMMATLLQQQGVTDLDAQVEAILIKEFGVDRLSLGANGPEAARRAMLMKIFSTSQKQLGSCSTTVTTTTESTSATPIPVDEETGERRAHVRVPPLTTEPVAAEKYPQKVSIPKNDTYIGVENFVQAATIFSSEESTSVESDDSDLDSNF